MKLTPAYQVEQEAKKALEEKCRTLYFDRLKSIEECIEYGKSEGCFNFTKEFQRSGNDDVNYTIENMIKNLLVGYGYKVWLTYPTDHIVVFEISCKGNYLSLLWKKIKQITSIICPKSK